MDSAGETDEDYGPSQELADNDAYALQSWTWTEHGYTKQNATEALSLFVDKGLVQVDYDNTHFKTPNAFFDHGECSVKKFVTVPSFGILNVPIKGVGTSQIDAECQCNLMILGELYRFGIIDTALAEIGELPTDIRNRANTKMGIFDKVPSPTEQITTTTTPSNSTINLVPSTSTSRSDSLTNTNGNGFLKDIEQMRKRFGGNNQDNQLQVDSHFHKDVTRRKFAAQVKSVDEIIYEQRQMNTGRVLQSNIPVQIIGGDGNGNRLIIDTFDEIQLTDEIKQTLKAMHYYEPTAVQKAIIPLVQKTQNDILCLAATGSGKTGAFLIPIVHRVQGFRYGPRGEPKPINTNSPYAIVVAHTKELAEQLYQNATVFATMTKVGVAFARGGMPRYDSRKQLTSGCDILVCTPGRLNQYFREGEILLNNLQFIVIDEADKFLSEDEFRDVLESLKNHVDKAKNTQYRTLLFSATINPILELLLDKILRPNYFHVIGGKCNQAVAHIPQIVIEVTVNRYGNNPRLKLLRKLLTGFSSEQNDGHFRYNTQRTIVFANEGRICDRIAVALSTWGFRAMSTNGHRSTERRYKAMEQFIQGKWHILVSTDIISRGINIPDLKNVVIYEMPPLHRYEMYVHRVGRTGRIAGQEGSAFVFIDPDNPNDQQLTEFLTDQLRQSNQVVPPFLEDIERERERVQSFMDAQTAPKSRPGKVAIKNTQMN